MNDLVKEYIETGKDLNTICDEKINNIKRKSFLTSALFIVIFGGHDILTQSRNIDLTHEVSNLKDTITYKNTVIDLQYNALDSAVYFHEIKNR